MESNAEWGDFHTGDPAREHRYTDFKANPAFVEFHEISTPLEIRQWLERKGLEVADLRDFGARWANLNDRPVIIYLFPDGRKYRDTEEPPRRWVDPGTWVSPKMIRRDTPEGVIVAEGETDAMQLARAYPAWDICCLMIGAKAITHEVLAALKPYDRVLVALDNDIAGEEGAKAILHEYPKTAIRMTPPHNDWCDTAVAEGLDPDPMSYCASRNVPCYTLQELMDIDLGNYEDNNWFEGGILPVSGSLVFHGAMKSLKSIVSLDMCRALATGTAFAGEDGYSFVNPSGPAKVGLIQMEIRPQAFQQQRIGSFLAFIPDEQRDLFLQNVSVYKLGDGQVPRLKIQQDDFRSEVYRFIEASEAQVIVFDPIQRLAGSADLDKTNEIDALLDFFAELQNEGLTVIFTHHNNKQSGPGARHPNAMAGSQRFGADADAICTLIHDPAVHLLDTNMEGVKQRNLSWTLRSGAATMRGTQVRSLAMDPLLMEIRFMPPFQKDDKEVADVTHNHAGSPTF